MPEQIPQKDAAKDLETKPAPKVADVTDFRNKIDLTTTQETVTQLSKPIAENPDLKPKQKDHDTNCLEEHAPAIFAAFKSGDRNALVSALGQRLNELAAPMSQQSQDAILARFDNQRQRDAVIKAVAQKRAEKRSDLTAQDPKKNLPLAIDGQKQEEEIMRKAGIPPEKFAKMVRTKGQELDSQWTQKHGAFMLSVMRAKGFMKDDSIERLRKQWNVSQKKIRDEEIQLMNQIMSVLVTPLLQQMSQMMQTMQGAALNDNLHKLRESLNDTLEWAGVQKFDKRLEAVVTASKKAENGDVKGAEAIIKKILKESKKEVAESVKAGKKSVGGQPLHEHRLMGAQIPKKLRNELPRMSSAEVGKVLKGLAMISTLLRDTHPNGNATTIPKKELDQLRKGVLSHMANKLVKGDRVAQFVELYGPYLEGNFTPAQRLKAANKILKQMPKT